MNCLGYWADHQTTGDLETRYGTLVHQMPLKSLLALRALVTNFRVIWQLEKDLSNQKIFERSAEVSRQTGIDLKTHDPEAYEYGRRICVDEHMGFLDYILEGLSHAVTQHPDY